MEIVLIQRFVLFLGFPTYSLSVVLFSLLTFTGVGAFLAPKFGLTKRTLTVGLAAAIVLFVVAAFVLQPMLASLITQPFGVRLLLAIVVIAPIGVLLGSRCRSGSTGSRRSSRWPCRTRGPSTGLASVVASVLGVAIALFAGFRFTMLVAAVCYGAALLHAAIGAWSESGDTIDLELEADEISVAAPV